MIITLAVNSIPRRPIERAGAERAEVFAHKRPGNQDIADLGVKGHIECGTGELANNRNRIALIRPL